MTSYTAHHTAISVADLDASKSFYAHFGFSLVAEWRKGDGSLVISHLRSESGYVLELFHFAAEGTRELPSFAPGNNLPEIGVKHLGLSVPDLAAARQDVLRAGIGEVTEITRGRTEVDYFFVIDPDGIYLEIVSDTRDLDERRPMLLGEVRRE